MADPIPPAHPDDAFLRHLGADDATCADLTERLASSAVGTFAGRVIRSERSGAEVATAAGALRVTWDDPVCTGDWVLVATDPGGDPARVPARRGRVVYLQLRRSAFVRRSADVERPQVLAANIDECWIVAPADQALSPPRVERTLVLAWESGAIPVLVLTKADLVPPAAAGTAREVMATVGPGVPLMAVSTVTGAGLAELAGRVGAGRTVALLGASGAGKSSLVNALRGADVLAVGPVRDRDGKGRHTTTWRELVVLAGGGALIDTPGLRSVGLWVDEGGLAAAFTDITDLAGSCRFSDCRHRSEPGCAVKGAIGAGVLPRRRLDSYAKLGQEAAQAEQRSQVRTAAQQRRVADARAHRIRTRDRDRDR